MSDTQENVQGAEALKKIKEIVGHVRSCQMQTGLNNRPIHTRPMSVSKIEEDGKMYFLSHKNSVKNKEINASNEMQITISNDGDNEYMTLYGTAEVFRDQRKIDELYSPFANNWFEGKEDPNITLIRFTPKDGHYWDTKHGKIIQFAGMLLGAITGKNASDAKEGKISV